METANDKVTVTINLERQLNGTVSTGFAFEGSGFHFFELIGLLQMVSYDMAKQSREIAPKLEKGKKSRIVLKNK